MVANPTWPKSRHINQNWQYNNENNQIYRTYRQHSWITVPPRSHHHLQDKNVTHAQRSHKKHDQQVHPKKNKLNFPGKSIQWDKYLTALRPHIQWHMFEPEGLTNHLWGCICHNLSKESGFVKNLGWETLVKREQIIWLHCLWSLVKFLVTPR